LVVCPPGKTRSIRTTTPFCNPKNRATGSVCNNFGNFLISVLSNNCCLSFDDKTVNFGCVKWFIILQSSSFLVHSSMNGYSEELFFDLHSLCAKKVIFSIVIRSKTFKFCCFAFSMTVLISRTPIFSFESEKYTCNW